MRCAAARAVVLTVALFGVVVGSVAGCGTDPGGHLYTALNESDHDVIIQLLTDDSLQARLPAHARGHLSGSFTEAVPGWQLTIRDVDCKSIATFALDAQPSRLTVHVTTAGDVELGAPTLFSLEGKDVELVTPLPPASCR